MDMRMNIRKLVKLIEEVLADQIRRSKRGRGGRKGCGGGIPPRPSVIFPKSRRRDFPEKKFEFRPGCGAL